MAHPLESGSVSPPPPNPDAGRQQPSGLAGHNALMMPNMMPQRQMPAPSHQQAVATIRHCMAVIGELKTLYKNPSLGKSSIKSAIIDGVSSLVGERMLSPANAVIQLASVPDDPLQQRKWVQQMINQTVAAQNNVVDHHAAGNHGSLDWATESQHAPGSADDHMATMDGVATHYRPSA